MLDQVKLKQLNQASADGDWTAAADICLELSLESKGTTDEFHVEELERAVRLQDADGLEIIINQLVRNYRPHPLRRHPIPPYVAHQRDPHLDLKSQPRISIIDRAMPSARRTFARLVAPVIKNMSNNAHMK